MVELEGGLRVDRPSSRVLLASPTLEKAVIAIPGHPAPRPKQRIRREQTHFWGRCLRVAQLASMALVHDLTIVERRRTRSGHGNHVRHHGLSTQIAPRLALGRHIARTEVS